MPVLQTWEAAPQYDPNHRFVGIRKPIRFAGPMAHVDSQTCMYESTFTRRNAFQGLRLPKARDSCPYSSPLRVPFGRQSVERAIQQFTSTKRYC
jgi:hypothetical protein